MSDPSTWRRWHRRLAGVCAAALAAATLGGCGQAAEGSRAVSASLPASGPTASASTGSTAGPEAGALPVTIEHKYGSTTITHEPTRIVTVGLVEQDPLLALGIVPIATTEWFGNRPGALYPWAEQRLKVLGGALPTVLTTTDGIQIERIAALHPDLILATYSDLSREDYEKLQVIAPTVAPPKGIADYGIGWEDAARTVGRAVGRPHAAEELVNQATALIAKARSEHPAFVGATALVAAAGDTPFVYGPDDPRTRLLASLGFTIPAGLRKVTGDTFGAEISDERVDLLNVDALVMLIEDAAAPTEKSLHNPVYTKLDVVRRGRVITADYKQNDFAGAFSFITVLSVPFIVDGLVPALAAAVDGDPNTVVPPLPSLSAAGNGTNSPSPAGSS